jgi:hypothetical protein
VFKFVSQGGVTAINNSHGTTWMTCLQCGLMYLLLYDFKSYVFTLWGGPATSYPLYVKFMSDKTCRFLCFHKVVAVTESYAVKPAENVEVKHHESLT